LVGAIAGDLLMIYLEENFLTWASLKQEIFSLFCLFVGLCLALFLQSIIHEAGHLIFGLLSGYQFSSFRIASFIWLKENDKLICKRFSLAGTGGQCLMSPPEMIGGSFPVILYNLGGPLLNLISAVLFGILAALLPENTHFLSSCLTFMAVAGLLLALTNGIPLRTAMIDNDGYNAFALTRHAEARHSFWVQLKVSELQTKGVRLKDMPAEWFAFPPDEEMQNSMVSVLGVFACNRLIDEQKFSETKQSIHHLLHIKSAIAGLYRYLLTCDYIYCELISENRQEVLTPLMTKDLKALMKKMKTFPSIQRTEYAYALLAEKDLAKAEKIKKQFEASAKNYPYPQDIQSERELMEIAEKIYQQTAL
jgi:hypothetical protein